MRKWCKRPAFCSPHTDFNYRETSAVPGVTQECLPCKIAPWMEWIYSQWAGNIDFPSNQQQHTRGNAASSVATRADPSPLCSVLFSERAGPHSPGLNGNVIFHLNRLSHMQESKATFSPGPHQLSHTFPRVHMNALLTLWHRRMLTLSLTAAASLYSSVYAEHFKYMFSLGWRGSRLFLSLLLSIWRL